jgi:hypothetical protein
MAIEAFFEKHYAKSVLAIWLVTSALIILLLRHQIAGWVMGDPDDQLRMVEVRDWIAGQSWFDVAQNRMNLPDGGPMHWSRIVDIPLAFIMLLARPFLGLTGAELAAAIIVPMLTYGATLFLVADIARRLFGKGVALLAAVTLWTSLLIMQQLAPMRIDHHGWQIVLFLACVSALCSRNATYWTGGLIGAALALWLNISIEGLPFAFVIIGVLGLRWLWPDVGDVKQSGRILTLTCASFAASSVLLFLMTHQRGDMATFCDTVSPPHLWSFVTLAALLAIGVKMAERIDAHNAAIGLFVRAAIGLCACSAGALIVHFAAPQCMSDAFADLDPVVRQYWFNRGLEGLPIWAQLPGSIHLAIGGMAAGLIATLYWNLNAHADQRRLSIEYLILLIASILIGSMVFRTTVYALSLSIITAAAFAASLFKRAEAGGTLSARMGWRVAATMLLLPGTIASSIGSSLTAATASSETARSDTQQNTLYDQIRKCQQPKTTMQLRALPTSQLLAPLDLSPAILQFTAHKVVATGHHRNQIAMRDVINAFILPPDQARKIFANRKIEYLALCPASFELMIYADDAPNGLWAQLKKGNRPEWLRPAINVGGNIVWEINQRKLAELGQ